MKIQIQSVKFNADQKLIEFIENKLGKLDRISENTTHAEVTLKLEKDHEQGNKLSIIRLAVPGSELMAERKSHSFEESVDHCIDALRHQIERYKAHQ